MQLSKIAPLVQLLTTVSFFALTANAECCPADSGGYCRDGTGGTPYCGYGPCNIFGCNCDGGCRKSSADESFTPESHTGPNSVQYHLQSGKHHISEESDFVQKFIAKYQKERCGEISEGYAESCLGLIIVDIVQAKAW